MAVPAIVPIAQGVTALTSFLSGIFSGGGGGEVQESGLTLPYEYEKRFMDMTDENLKQIKADLLQLDTVTKAYQENISFAEKYQKGLIGDEEYAKQIGEQNQRIAKAFGGDVESAIKSGYLTEDSEADLQALKDLESENFTDPTLERQIKDQRKQLEQDLKRSGASPAAQALALQQFNQSAEEQRFSVGNELRNQKYQRMTGTIQTGSMLKKQGYDQAMTTAQFLQQNTQNLQSGMQQLLAYGQEGYNTEAMRLGVRGGYRREEAKTFEDMGGYKFSPRATEYSANKAAGTQSSPATTTDKYTQQFVDTLHLDKMSDNELAKQLKGIPGTHPGPGQYGTALAQRDALVKEQQRRLYKKI